MATVASEVKVNRNAVNAIARAINTALDQVRSTGSLLTQCVTVARQQYRGKPIPEADVNGVLDSLQHSQGWTDASAKIRRSEYKTVLANYALLPEAITAYRDKSGSCTWGDGIALARLLKDHKPKEAAKAHMERGAGSGSKLPWKARAASAIKRVLKLKRIDKKFADELRALCAEHNINV